MNKKQRLTLNFFCCCKCSAGTAIEVIAINVMQLITLVTQSAAISPLTDPVTAGPGRPDAASTQRTHLMIFDVAAGTELRQTRTPGAVGGGRHCCSTRLWPKENLDGISQLVLKYIQPRQEMRRLKPDAVFLLACVA